MVPATDSAKRFPARRVGICLTLMTFLVGPGCARLRSFRNTEKPPAFGTEPVAPTIGRSGQSSGGDLYAGRLGRAQPSRAPAPTVDSEEDAPVPDPGNRPLVALQPPETLPAAGTAQERQTAGVDRLDEPLSTRSRPKVDRTSTETDRRPTLDQVLAGSRRQLESLTSYRVNMNLQERVGGALKPAEDVVLNIRRNPKAVRIEWPSGPNKGREVLYAPEANGGLMYIHMTNGLIPQMKLSPDSPLATANSRHPITEAGFGTIVENMETAARRQESGDSSLGRIRYDGLETPESFQKACHKLVRVTPTQETWTVYLDPENNLPVLVQAKAENGDLLERYVFRDLTVNPSDLATADAFSPEGRWGPPRGLFQRLARSGASTLKETEAR